MVRVSLALTGGIGIVLSALGCGAPAPQAEGLPIDTRDNILEQGVIDCSPWQDTGYVQGSPFPITLVRVDGKPAQIDTANAYHVMQQAAAAAGVSLRIVSGFRSMADQQYLYSCYINCSCNNCNLAATPGYSNHQSGHALDLNTSEGGVLSWLNAHGGAYGFSRTVPSESWHWEWWGGGPGGGPCGGDPECVANPNHGGCDGTRITYCDENNQLHQGDCGAFGAGCSTGGGKPHCVHFLCLSNLDGGENGSFCLDDSRLATCTWGEYGDGDCGAYGATCSDAYGGGHCVHFMCWSNLDGGEDGAFCLDDTRIGSCARGVYEEGDCGVYGATCSEQGGQAHCVHFMCWSNLDGGEDGSFCVDGSTLGSCAMGAYEELDCAQDETCVAQQDGARCQVPGGGDITEPTEPENPTDPENTTEPENPTEPETTTEDPGGGGGAPGSGGDNAPPLGAEAQGAGEETPARAGCGCAARADASNLSSLLLLALLTRVRRARG
jgi:hypothetical protein